MALSAKRVQSLKLIHPKTKILVHGFIRTYDNHYKIPEVIMSICVLFYNIIKRWDSANIGKNMTIMEDKSIIKIHCDKSGSGVGQSAFLKSNITLGDAEPKRNHQWKFTLLEFDNEYMYNLVIGLWDFKHEPNIQNAVNGAWNHGWMNEKRYAFIATTGDLITGGCYSSWYGKHLNENYDEKYKSGDVIEMYLNGNMLGFKKNGTDLGINYTVTDSVYKVVFYVHTGWRKSVSIQLHP